nr:hypothetical protein [Leuconostoc suionicum]
MPVSIDCTSNFRCVQVYSLVQQRKNQSCQSKNKSCLISSALDKKYSELLTYEHDDVNNYEAFMLSELAEHAKNLENNLLPELERMRLDTRWLSEYYEELADVKKVLDEFNVV